MSKHAGGRPPEEGETRSEQLVIRLTPSCAAKLDALASRANKTRSDVVRALIERAR